MVGLCWDIGMIPAGQSSAIVEADFATLAQASRRGHRDSKRPASVVTRMRRTCRSKEAEVS